MHILLIVASSDGEFRDFLARDKKAALFPPEAMRKGFFGQFKWKTQVNTADPASFKSPNDFQDFILSRASSATIIFILIEDNYSHLVNGVTSAVICAIIESNINKKSYQNYISSKVSRLLKAANYIAEIFKDQAGRTLLSLPLRNFHADEIDLLKSAAKNSIATAEFNAALDASLKGLRSRLRPRKKTANRTIYAVDDRDRFFIYGKELHSRPDTGEGHFSSCIISASFRLGMKIDDRRHFNVSEGEKDETSISGSFLNCHDNPVNVLKTSHLNMFSNDFF